eukprot:33300-Prymnesium_polylepis.1
MEILCSEATASEAALVRVTRYSIDPTMNGRDFGCEEEKEPSGPVCAYRVLLYLFWLLEPRLKCFLSIPRAHGRMARAR